MIGFVFPGQGTVRVGMGAWLRADPAAAAVLKRVDELLDEPVGPLCAHGPLDRLVDTAHAQPAVTACNLAALAILTARGHRPDIVAGHSVGELSALCAAGVLDPDDTVRLVEVRSRLMAALPAAGGMASVLGLPLARVEELADEAVGPDEPLVVGLDNAPENVVVSGALPAIERLTKLATDARKVVPLKVSNAFHSPLMAPALEEWAAAVDAAPLSPPRIPVVLNVTGEPTTDVEQIRAALVAQLTGRVRWTATMTALSHVDRMVEVGDSKTLSGLARVAGLRCVSMASPAGLRELGRVS